MTLPSAHLVAAVLLSMLLPCAAAMAQPGSGGDEEKSPEEVIEEYCTAISDQASGLRAARELEALKEMQAKINGKLDELETAKAGLKAELDRREEMRNLAKKELVEIYSGMDPAAAAAQMDKIDMRLASSIVRQLKPRLASAILDEMEPDLAAKLVRYIAAVAAAEEAAN